MLLGNEKVSVIFLSINNPQKSCELLEKALDLFLFKNCTNYYKLKTNKQKKPLPHCYKSNCTDRSGTLVAESTEAPLPSSSCTRPTWPSLAARWRALSPFWEKNKAGLEAEKWKGDSVPIIHNPEQTHPHIYLYFPFLFVLFIYLLFVLTRIYSHSERWISRDRGAVVMHVRNKVQRTSFQQACTSLIKKCKNVGLERGLCSKGTCWERVRLLSSDPCPSSAHIKSRVSGPRIWFSG